MVGLAKYLLRILNMGLLQGYPANTEVKIYCKLPLQMLVAPSNNHHHHHLRENKMRKDMPQLASPLVSES